MWVVLQSKIQEILVSPSAKEKENLDYRSKIDKYESFNDCSDYHNDMNMRLSKDNSFHCNTRQHSPKSPGSPNIFPLSDFIYYQFNYLLSFLIYGYELWKNSMTFFFLSPIEIILDFIISNIYFIYVTIPFMILSYIWSQLLYFLGKICRKYELARKCLIHISEIIKVIELIWRKAKRSSLFDLTCFILQNVYEIICLWIWPSNILNRRTTSLTELSELLEYEELQFNGKPFNNTSNKANVVSNNIDNEIIQMKNKKYMHHDIPFNPFKATIKIRKVVPLSTGGAIAVTQANPSSLTNSTHSHCPHNTITTSTVTTNNTNSHNTGFLHFKPFSIMDFFHSSKSQTLEDESLNFETEMLSDSFLEQFSILNDADTPASFPPTPFSRAYVMNRSAERVNSVMFAARDKLRQAVQSISADAQSRQYAYENRSQGYFGVFDPKKSSENIALTCGNHCVTKIGNSSFCSSSQSMMPLITGNYVYFEFSMTACNNSSNSNSNSGSVTQAVSKSSTFSSPPSCSLMTSSSSSLALGLSPPDAPLNVMVGSWSRSISINTDGHLLMHGSQWSQLTQQQKLHKRKQCTSTTASKNILLKSSSSSSSASSSSASSSRFMKPVCIKPGATVGFLVYLPSNSGDNNSLSSLSPLSPSSLIPAPAESLTDLTANTSERHLVEPETTGSENITNKANTPGGVNETNLYQSPYVFRIHIDGVPCEYPPECDEAIKHVMSDIEKLSTPLFPTVSLLSNNIRIWCRFCEADIVYRNRHTIGVEDNVRVYCVDGSILIHETDE